MNGGTEAKVTPIQKRCYNLSTYALSDTNISQSLESDNGITSHKNIDQQINSKTNSGCKTPYSTNCNMKDNTKLRTPIAAAWIAKNMTGERRDY